MPQEKPTPLQVLNGLRDIFFARVSMVESERNAAVNSWVMLEEAFQPKTEDAPDNVEEFPKS